MLGLDECSNMARRTWQVFVAPGNAEDALPIPPSPWHCEREARIPLEQWNLIWDFAQRIDPQQAQLLDQATYLTNADSHTEAIALSPDQVQTLLTFIARLQDEIAQAAPLVPIATEEVPDEYENEEHIRMLAAVAAVFRESLRLGEPFNAWLD
ncbi:MAG: hypothetical protein M3Z04_16580 [Chloroflexota bacterium]|nr:hypothetical protein [Chloroflexota bacterium]